MIKLTIFKKDGSIYWEDNFPTIPAMKTWLAEEMTRPYWDKSYTFQFVDNTKDLLAAQAAAKVTQDAADAVRAQAIADVKALAAKPLMSMTDIGTSLNKLIQVLGL